MVTHIRRFLIFSIVICGMGMLIPQGEAEINRWSVGGVIPWAAQGQLVAIDDTTYPGAIQPRELLPWVNVLCSPEVAKKGVGTTSLGMRIYIGRFISDPDFQKDLDMRFWWGYWDLYGESRCLVDGNTSPTSSRVYELRPYQAKKGVLFAAFDTGIPLPVNRLEFYPPQTDEEDPYGNRYRDDYLRGYIVSASPTHQPSFLEDRLSASGGRWRENPMTPMLEKILGENPYNFDSIVEVNFPLQYLRYFRVISNTDYPFAVAEVELYGEGFVPKAVFTSKIIDLKGPMNFGRLWFKLSKWRAEKVWDWQWDKDEEGNIKFDEKGKPKKLWKVVGGDPEPVLLDPTDPEAWVEIETRSGSDTTPLVYHKITDTMEEEECSKEEFKKATPQPPPSLPSNPNPSMPRPGMQGSVTYDDEHWSPWSVPITRSGEQIQSPGPRRYFQFRVTLRSKNFWKYCRLDSLVFEYSPPLVGQVLGEVAVLGEPNPPEGVAQVKPGLPTTFTYDLKAQFSSATQEGFNAIALVMPAKVTLEKLEMGKPLAPVDPLKTRITSDSLIIYLPRKITPDNNEPVRITFTTPVFIYGTRFTGKVFNTESSNLPQMIWAGNANDEVSTDKLKVLTTETTEQVLINVKVSPSVITPNQDDRNDQADISYTILRVIEDVAKLDVDIFDLNGHQVRKIYSGNVRSVSEQKKWDARDNEGKLVAPGLYLCRVLVTTDTEVSQEIRPIAVAY